MAHGGTLDWNRSVNDAVRGLRSRVPTALSFGMADPATLRSGLDSLRARNVERVALVRLFITGSSFLERTESILGLSSDAPAVHATEGHGSMGPIVALDHSMEIVTHREGLADHDRIAEVLDDRAAELSVDPGRESVLILAHGVGDDSENTALLASMGAASERVARRGFRRVKVATLREDWEEKRAAAEAAVREYVERERAAGARVLVVPFRLSGFGPYGEALVGLEYEAGRGMVPHPVIEDWLEETAARLMCGAGWANPLSGCGPARLPVGQKGVPPRTP